MKKLLLATFTFLAFFNTSSIQAQTTYLGLKAEAQLDAAQLATNGLFWSRTRIIDDYIYVSTWEGLFRKSLTTLNDTTWEMHDFAGIPIRDFIVKGTETFAVTGYKSDSLLVYSDGNTTTFLDDSHFLGINALNAAYRMDQNPQDVNELTVLHHSGVSRSQDFGTTWDTLFLWSPEFQYRSLAYDPNDPQTIAFSGENGFFTSFLQMTYDAGTTWENVDQVPNNCTHYVAFHPTNPDVVISGGEGRITKSNDKGQTWEASYFTPNYVYIYKVVFDANDPNVVYAAGAINGANETLTLFRSANAGDTWEVFYEESLPGSKFGEVVDFEIHQNQALFLTINNGVLLLDLDAVSVNQINTDLPRVTIYPNPSTGLLSIASEAVIKQVKIRDSTGKLIQQITSNSWTNLDISLLASGLYTLEITTKNGVVYESFVRD